MNKQEANKFKIDAESFSNTQFFNFVCESFQYTLNNISVMTQDIIKFNYYDLLQYKVPC